MTEKKSSPGHQRPLSPHLQIYRLQLTSVLSGLHRITGFFLFLCLPLWTAFIWMLSTSQAHFEAIAELYRHPVMLLIFLGLLGGYCYHFFNGIRHLIWDRARGLELDQVYRSGWFTIIAATLSTALLAVLFYIKLGDLL
ncbi:succinate dehydrogenase, cytochrome b556 subunit [Alphaproteobacteria bacterium]|nr:succinate dehydrogenase, cytochrome b556 subunit [Alphaproteobacteria bacterium]